jgi:CDP-diacylglycerol--glycerol-3-phosphate 3-phosphatidyltransferase
MISKQIGRFYLYPRDAIAHGLLRIGVRPNHMTVLGMLLTLGAGVSLAAGRPYWSTWFVGLLVGAGACDLLDGALAKLGHFESRFGGFLDSVCDRLGDAALYLGPAFYFIARPGDPEAAGRPNLTLALLACVGLVWAYLISYIKARAETAGGRAGGGFWPRAAGHDPAGRGIRTLGDRDLDPRPVAADDDRPSALAGHAHLPRRRPGRAG